MPPSKRVVSLSLGTIVPPIIVHRVALSRVNQFCRFTCWAWPRCWAASVR